jgi:hypothetical protein
MVKDFEPEDRRYLLEAVLKEAAKQDQYEVNK